MANERARERRRWSEVFVDRQFYERGAGGGRLVSVTRRTQIFLALGFTLAVLTSLGLLAAGYYGYLLYEERGQRLAALEADGLAAAAPAAGDGVPAGNADHEGTSEADLWRAQLAELRSEFAAATIAHVTATELTGRELDALRAQLEAAEAARNDAELDRAASLARVAALEAELGMGGGSAAALVDGTGQPLASLETVKPADLATLGMELRLVEREREAARAQLDLALERVAELEAADADAVPDAIRRSDDVAVIRHFDELTAERDALLEAQAALEASLEALAADHAALQAAAERTRDDLLARLAAADERVIESAVLEAEQQRLERELAESQTERETVLVERDTLAATARDLEAAHQTAAEEAAAAAAERDRLAGLSERTQLALAEAEAERDALAGSLATTEVRVAELENQLALRESTLLAELEAASSDARALEAERDKLTELAAMTKATVAELQAQSAAREAALVVERDSLAEALVEADTTVASVQAELAAATDAVETAEARAIALELERERLASARAAEQVALTTALAEQAALKAELADLEARARFPAGPGAELTAAAIAALEARNAALTAAFAAAEEAAENELWTLREDMATLTKATNDALAAQNAAHAGERARLADVIAALETELAALRSQNESLIVVNEQQQTAGDPDAVPAAGGNGDGREGVADGALRAANERIAALEEELVATTRLAAELGALERPTANETPTPDVVPQANAATASEAELVAALDRIKDLDAQLASAQTRLATLQRLLLAQWPGPPRPAPR